jgi:ATP-binding cassette subfamily B protein
VSAVANGLRNAIRSRSTLGALAWRVSPALAASALTMAVVSALVPPAFNIAAGIVGGRVQDAVRAGEHSLGPIVPAFALAAGLYLAAHVTGPIREGLCAVLMRRVDAALTADIMQAVSRPRGVAHLEDPAVLDLMAQAQGELTVATPGTAVYHAVQVSTQVLQGLCSVLILAVFSPPLAAGLLAGHVVAFRWRRRHWTEVTATVMDRTEGLRRAHYVRRLAVEPEAAKEARVFSLAGWLRQRYRHEFLAVMDAVWRRRRSSALGALGVTAMMLAVEGGILGFIASQAVDGRLGLGAALVYAQVTVAASSLSQFNEGYLFVADGAESARRLRRLRDAMPAAAAAAGDQPADGLPRQSIRFEQVRFAYPGAPTDLFTALDLDIEAGTSLAIVGSNGAGKTTLVKLLARLYEPTGGRITVDGIDLRDIDPTAWQQRIAAVFQDFVTYKLTAADNVAFGALHVERDADALDRAAAAAGAAALVRKLPHGWDTVLSRGFDDGTDLSGGESQRLALARAIYAVQAGGAGVLVLDEPTAALDVRGEAEVYDRFLDLTRGLTTIVVSHRFSTVRRADRIVVIEHGRVVEDGSHDALVAMRGRYAAMYELQAARFRDDAAAAAGSAATDEDDQDELSA